MNWILFYRDKANGVVGPDSRNDCLSFRVDCRSDFGLLSLELAMSKGKHVRADRKGNFPSAACEKHAKLAWTVIGMRMAMGNGQKSDRCDNDARNADPKSHAERHQYTNLLSTPLQSLRIQELKLVPRISPDLISRWRIIRAW